MATEHAQPAIGVASLAYLELIEALGLQPDMAGGHSFGELTALPQPAHCQGPCCL